MNGYAGQAVMIRRAMVVVLAAVLALALALLAVRYGVHHGMYHGLGQARDMHHHARHVPVLADGATDPMYHHD